MAKNVLGFKARQNREKKATDLAGDILEVAGLLTAPVNPFALAEQESPRLAVKSGNLKDSFDGRLEYHAAHDRFILFLNTKYDQAPGEHHPRTRFSAAHEIGHFYLDEHRAYLMNGGQAHSSASEFAANNNVERQADAFAVGLLMPEKLIRPLVNRGELTVERIMGLAAHFQTSFVSTAIRSVSVSDFPCEIVGLRNGSVAWRFPSQSMIDGGCYPLSKGAILSPGARRQWEAFCRGQLSENESSASPFHWFQSYGAAQKDTTVWEYYLPVPAMNTLLVLLTIAEEDLFPVEDNDGLD